MLALLFVPFVGGLFGLLVSVGGDEPGVAIAFLSFYLVVAATAPWAGRRWLRSVEYRIGSTTLLLRHSGVTMRIELRDVERVKQVRMPFGVFGLTPYANRTWDGLIIESRSQKSVFIGPSDTRDFLDALIRAIEAQGGSAGGRSK